MLNGKMTSYQERPFTPESNENSENGVWMRDKRNGQRILYFSESLTTFDSGDRIYDSVAKWYFMCDKGGLSVINIHHGYQLGGQ